MEINNNNYYGDFLTFYAYEFNEGIEYAAQNKIETIHINGIIREDKIGKVMDFNTFKKISEHLKTLVFYTKMTNIINLEGIYYLNNLEELNFREKQNFVFDTSKFAKLKKFGTVYWTKLININKTKSLEVVTLKQYPYEDLRELTDLENLISLNINHSKIKTLNGIEKYHKLNRLWLEYNKHLEDIHKINELNNLTELYINKCQLLKNISLANNLEKIKDVSIRE